MTKQKHRKCNYKKHDGGICGEKVLSALENGLCIFHEEIENKDTKKCMKLFYDKLRKGETDFEGYILKDVYLKNTEITEIGVKGKIINFRNAIFSRFVSFGGVTFSERADFTFATFEKADFISATFSEGADFSDANFKRASFYGATFSERADFNHAAFIEVAYFNDATFKGADFNHATFLGKANFEAGLFKEGVDFTSAVFERKGSFKYRTINIAKFNDSELRHVSFDKVDLTNSTFYGALIDEAYISRAILTGEKLREKKEALYGRKKCADCGTVVMFPSPLFLKINEFVKKRFPVITNKFLVKTTVFLNHHVEMPLLIPDKCEGCKTVLNEKTLGKNPDYKNHLEMFRKAEDVCRNIKLSLQNEGDYENAGEFYYNEMVMRRKKKYYENNLSYWLFSHIYSKICGYGEKPKRVVLTAFLIIFCYAILYFNLQAITPDLIGRNIDFSEALYFSIVTFTTLGYGDYHPTQSFQHLATSEAIIGAFMMALFVLVFGRKMLR